MSPSSRHLTLPNTPCLRTHNLAYNPNLAYTPSLRPKSCHIRKKVLTSGPRPLVADEARFELAEGVALTRFRGVLLRPLGHSSRCCIKQLVYYAIASRRVKSAWRITGPRLSGEMWIDGSGEGIRGVYAGRITRRCDWPWLRRQTAPHRSWDTPAGTPAAHGSRPVRRRRATPRRSASVRSGCSGRRGCHGRRL